MLVQGEIFLLKQQYDSTRYYYSLAKAYRPKNAAESMINSRMGDLYVALKQYDTAILYLNNALQVSKKANGRNQVMWSLLSLGKAYKGKGDVQKAIKTGQELLQLATETGARQYIRDAHLLLHEIFEELQYNEKAFFHLKHYMVLKDSIDTDLSEQKLAFYKIKSEKEKDQARINVLTKEKELQLQQLTQDAFTKKALLACIFFILLISVFVFRNVMLKRRNEKLRNQKEQIDSLHKTTELEMRALRAQMNPHFIFNCLNSINRFILKNNTDEASDYLTKFSRLIRMVLNLSQKSFILLAEELECLKLYIQLEQMRFKNAFYYHICCDEAIDMEEVLIPPLLLQPFVENAIWHGLMHKEDNGILSIAIIKNDNHLICTIKDNGIGRKTAALLNNEKLTQKSLGLQITKERLKLLEDDHHNKASFEVIDIENENGEATGTEVIITIPVKNMIETEAVSL
jgi:tetratricopeptide (TPR) repeat protein